MIAVCYPILRIQCGILNPNAVGGLEPSLAFNTVISFMANAKMLHDAGESAMSYLGRTSHASASRVADSA